MTSPFCFRESFDTESWEVVIPGSKRLAAAPDDPSIITALTDASTTSNSIIDYTPSNSTTGSPNSKTSTNNRRPILECDYDVNPTVLYQAIEAQSWLHVMALFDKCALPNMVKDERSPKVQAETWVDRKEANGKPRWRLLPIHAAVIFHSPVEVVETLLEAYPEGVRCKDDREMLPLHLAFKHGRGEVVIELLTKAYPKSVGVRDGKGRIPIECAAVSNNPTRGIVTYASSAEAVQKANNEKELIKLKAEHDAVVMKMNVERAWLEESSKKLAQDVEKMRNENSELTKANEKLRTELEAGREKHNVAIELVTKLERATSSLEKMKELDRQEREEQERRNLHLHSQEEEMQKLLQDDEREFGVEVEYRRRMEGTQDVIRNSPRKRSFLNTKGHLLNRIRSIKK